MYEKHEEQESGRQQAGQVQVIHLVNDPSEHRTYCGLRARDHKHTTDELNAEGGDYVFCPLCEAVYDIRRDGTRQEKWNTTHWARQVSRLYQISAGERAADDIDVNTGITRRVRRIMAERGITQDEAAHAMCAVPGSFARKLNGTTRWTLPDVTRLASTFGVPLQQFFI